MDFIYDYFFLFLVFFFLLLYMLSGLMEITILQSRFYSGICHSDLHIARNDFGISIYPVVPGYAFIRS
jgi:hypothetical protein